MEFEEALKVYKSCKVWAVIGVTQDETKFGYKIFKRLKAVGKEVYGISPKYEEVDGEKLYSNIVDVPQKPDVVVFVVNPSIGINELDNIKKMGIKNIWLQPGTISSELLQKADSLNLNKVDKCVLVVSEIEE